MNIDLTKLMNHVVEYIEVDFSYSFDEELWRKESILQLEPVHIVGQIQKNALDQIEIVLSLTGKMTLPDVLTLEPVEFPFETTIEGNLEEIMGEIDQNHKIIENSLDLFPIIWENVVMEIPMRVTSSERKEIPQEGNGWKLITEEPMRANPELEKLKSLLEEKEVF